MSATQPIRETDLYDPVKRLLEAQGYEVKGEVGAADVVAKRGDEEPIIVELKTRFSLALFHQAIQRCGLSDRVYVAVPHATGKPFMKALRNNTKLCRRLGLGLITVKIRKNRQLSRADVHLDPAPYQPRQSKPKKQRLLREFQRRVGDPNRGGSNRKILMTAYRQDALRCLRHLAENGPTKASVVKDQTDVDRARAIMADDHYGWFERVATGIYAITPKGTGAMEEFAEELTKLDR